MSSTTFIASYLEVLAGLLIYAIAIPFTALTVSPRIRAIRDRHARRFQVYDWEINISQLLRSESVVGIIVLSIVFLAGYLVPPLPSMCSTHQIGWWCKPHEFFHSYASYIAFGILCLNVLVLALFTNHLASYSTERVLSDLTNECKFQAIKNHGHIDRTLLASIGELGELCNAGHDKESVLEKLSNLTDLDLTLEMRVYLARIVRETTVAGSERNYEHAINILQDICREAFAAERNEVTGVDYVYFTTDVMRELEKVMVQAFAVQDSRVKGAILAGYEVLALQSPNAYAHAFLRIAKAGFAHNEIDQAAAVLDKFHTKVTEILSSSDSTSEDIPEAVHVFFGLLAHFWHYGDSARQHALAYLEALASLPQWNTNRVDKHLYKAKVFFQHSDATENADYLEQMLFEKSLRSFVIDFLSGIPQLDEMQYQRILTHYPSLEALHQATLEGIMACGISKAVAEIIYSQSRLAATSYSQNMPPIDAIKQWMTRFLRSKLHLQ